MYRLTTQLASLPDRDAVVCEVWCEDEQVAEVSCEHGGESTIQIYPRTSGGSWCFVVADLQAVLAEAKQKLNDTK